MVVLSRFDAKNRQKTGKPNREGPSRTRLAAGRQDKENVRRFDQSRLAKGTRTLPGKATFALSRFSLTLRRLLCRKSGHFDQRTAEGPEDARSDSRSPEAFDRQAEGFARAFDTAPSGRASRGGGVKEGKGRIAKKCSRHKATRASRTGTGPRCGGSGRFRRCASSGSRRANTCKGYAFTATPARRLCRARSRACSRYRRTRRSEMDVTGAGTPRGARATPVTTRCRGRSATTTS